jgi:TctA family transporter
MEIGVGLPEALRELAQGDFLLFFLIGVLNGLVFGLLPGLSGSVGIALMIPLTFGLGASESMALFVAALSGQTFAGSISAILLNTPGTAPNAATTFDGYPLARQGRGGFALGISATASALGSLIGVAILVVLLPVVRSVVLAFSFPEFTVLIVMGLAAISMASRGAMIKGLISGAIGLIFSFVGFSPLGGELRYVFGMRTLWNGIDVIAVLIGLFAVSEVMRLLVRQESVALDASTTKFGFGQVFEGVRYVLGQPFLLIRSSVVGTALGIIPAVGGTVAAFLSYFQAAQTSKDGKFGSGDPRGVLAPEAANDAKDAGAALPSLAFGLPGSADWAIILGAMILHGVTPGPNLIRERPDVVWIAILVIALASILTSVIGIAAAPYLLRLTAIRPSLLAPVVGALALVGSFALERQLIDVYVAVAFGVLGYYMKRYTMPLVPLILGLLLGEQLERSVFHSLDLFGRGPAIFFTRPISLVLVLITVAILASSVLQAHRAKRRRTEERQDRLVIGDLVLTAVLFAISVGAFLLAFGLQNPQSRLFPLYASGTSTVLTGLYLVVVSNGNLRRRFAWVAGEDPATMQIRDASKDAPVDGSISADAGEGPLVREELEPARLAAHPTSEERRVTVETPAEAEEQTHSGREFALIALLVGLAVGIMVIGTLPAVAVFLVATIAGFARERWLTTVLVSGVTVLALHVLFRVLLQIPLGNGRIAIPFLG